MYKKYLVAYQKNFKYFMAHQYMSKLFHGPCKNPLASPPAFLMYGPL